MPIIELRISDLSSLLSGLIVRETLEEQLKLVKGELKEFDPEQDRAKIELNDSNRPDLWSPEGISRQIRWVESGQKLGYPYFAIERKSNLSVLVSKEVQTVRPYVAACAARGVRVTPDVLNQLIQTQEKLAEIFGRKRRTVSVGLYRLARIAFPIRYELADPDCARFIPLGFDEEMSLREIVNRHPKGMAYGQIVSSHPRYPILIDARDQILSFPPVINSRTIGEVQTGDTELLVETTGEDLRMVILVLNVFACNLIDRGARIEPATVHYTGKTQYGKAVQTPRAIAEPVALNLRDVDHALGEEVSSKDVKRYLSLYGYTVIGKGKRLKVTPPLYRDDVMHPIDLIEDFAIVRGYDSFAPEMPTEFTAGKLSDIERASDRFRELMIGLSFQETISNILTSRVDLVERMRLSGGSLVEVGNPMVESFSVLRNRLIPSLLAAEAQSAKAFYPHRLFEVGEVAQLGEGGRTESPVHLAALIAHASASFSELHAYLEALFYYSMVDYRLDPLSEGSCPEASSFIEGRAGRVLVREQEVGLIGEVHPQVITNWQIGMPAVVFEFDLDRLADRLRPPAPGKDASPSEGEGAGRTAKDSLPLDRDVSVGDPVSG